MNQYAFQISTKNGTRCTVHCTAPSESFAWLQVVAKYGAEFRVNHTASAVFEPHHFFAEIDAADMTEADAKHMGLRIDLERLASTR